MAQKLYTILGSYQLGSYSEMTKTDHPLPYLDALKQLTDLESDPDFIGWDFMLSRHFD